MSLLGAASKAAKVLEAAQVLAPLIEQVANFLEGEGDEPEVLRLLPAELKSEVALRALKARRARNADG